MRIKRIKDLEPQFLTQGIFTYINQMADCPWSAGADTLNRTFYLNYAGQKRASPLTAYLAGENDDGYLTAANEQTLANDCAAHFMRNWVKEYATYSAVYDPINNYDMSETEVTERERDNTGTVGTVGNDATETESSTTSADGIYGFNSSASVGDRDNRTSAEANTSSSLSSTRTDDLKETETESRTLTRSGNIGVTTTQQMLQSERELWEWDFFNGIVFRDCCKVLCIDTY